MPTTFNSWPVVSMPEDPPSPASIEFSANDAVALQMSPFTGQQQTQNWGPLPMEASVLMPPMTHAQATTWVQWLRDLEGVQGVFQFPTTFASEYSESIGSRYWRLKSNMRKWSVSGNRFFGFQFDIREAL